MTLAILLGVYALMNAYVMLRTGLFVRRNLPGGRGRLAAGLIVLLYGALAATLPIAFALEQGGLHKALLTVGNAVEGFTVLLLFAYVALEIACLLRSTQDWVGSLKALVPESTREDAKAILTEYQSVYDPADDMSAWFDKVKVLADKYGFAPETKLYKKNPEAYKGPVGDVSMVLRVAICGRTNAPDLYSVMQLLGADKVRERLARCAQAL